MVERQDKYSTAAQRPEKRADEDMLPESERDQRRSETSEPQLLALFTNRPKCYERRKTYAWQQHRNRTHAKWRKVKEDEKSLDILDAENMPHGGAKEMDPAERKPKGDRQGRRLLSP